MAKNKNYKYNAFAEQEEAAKREAIKKRNKIILVIAAALVALGVVICIAVAIWFAIPRDYCFYYRDREVNEAKVTYVEMKVKGYDEPIVLLLDAKEAKVTVENFVTHVREGFYDGLTLHRGIKGCMIQGGSAPADLPEEEQPETIIGEFSSNNITYNDLLHKRGVISMARATGKDSASTGFFICDADVPDFDGNYAAFGYVISGLFTVDAIADYMVGKTDSDGNLLASYEQPVIEYIKVIDKK